MDEKRANAAADQRELVTEVLPRGGTSNEAGQTTSLSGALGPGAGESRASPSAVPTAAPVIPGFEIERVLGRGGMGIVYLAHQTSLKRRVALKMVLGDLADSEELSRFRLEAEAIARLQHPQLVQVFAVGACEGRPYCVLEYLEGGSLAQQRAGSPRPPQEAARLMELLARGAQCAHDSGVVHRDLKPSNILLAADGTPKIADFGLVKRIDDQSGLTRTGTILGTPSYMAPEQAEGRINEVGPRSDVYSLGAILYELLTGRPPFRGATVLDTLAQVRSEDPVRPTQMQPGLSRDIETICLKCLEKSPRRRYASAADLADDLRRWLDGHPIAARPVGRWERFRKWTRREPRLAALSGVLVGVVAIAFCLVTWQLSVARRTGGALQMALVDKTNALAAESMALEQQRFAFSQEREARGEAQRQTALKQLELERAERALHGNRVARALRELELFDAGRADQLLLDCDVRQREWEWHALRRLSQRLRLRFAEHVDAHLVRIRGDGRQLLTFRDPVLRIDDREATVRVWDAETGHETLVVKGNVGGYSPDGQLFAILARKDAPDRCVVQIHDAQTGGWLRTCQGELGVGIDVAFVDGGRAVVAADLGGAVARWDTDTGLQRYRVGGPDWAILPHMIGVVVPRLSVFSADGGLLSLISGPLIDTTTGELRANLGRHRGATFSADGHKVAFHSQLQGGVIRVVETKTGADVMRRDAPAGPGGRPAPFTNLRLRFNPAGSILWCGTGRANLSLGQPGKLVAWKVPSGDELFAIVPGSNAITALAVSPDGRTVAVGGDNGAIQLRDASSGEVSLILRTQPGRTLTDLAFLPDGGTLASVSASGFGVAFRNDAETQLWDVRPRAQSLALRLTTPSPKPDEQTLASPPFGAWNQVAFSDDGATVSWTGIDDLGRLRSPGQISLAEALEKARPAENSVAPADVPGISQLPPAPARRFAILGRTRDANAGLRPGRLVILDTDEAERVLLEEGTLNVHSGQLDRTRRRLFTTLSSALSWRNTPPRRLVVKVWGLEESRELWSLDRGEARGGAATLSPDGKRAAWTERGDDGRIQLLVWDVGAERAVSETQVDDDASGLQFSDDNRRLAITGRLGSLRLLHVERREPPLVLEGHQGRIHDAVFNAKATRLVTGGADLRVRLWDTNTGQQLVELTGSDEVVESVAISPDGKWLAASDTRGGLRLWNGTPLPEPAYVSWPPSLEELNRAIAQGGANVQIWRQRARWLERAGNGAAAAESLAKAAELEAGNKDGWLEALTAATKSERWDLVVRANSALVEIEPRESSRWLSRGEAQARQLQFREAANDFARGEQLVGNNLELKLAVIGLKWLAKERDQALAAQTQAIEQASQSGWASPQHPNSPRNAYLLARLTAFSPEKPVHAEQLLAWAKQALADQATPWHWHVVGLVHLRLGEWNEALRAFRESRQLDAEWCPELNEAASALVMLKRSDDGESRQVATRVLGRHVMRSPASRAVWHLHDWIGLQLLRQELETQVGE